MIIKKIVGVVVCVLLYSSLFGITGCAPAEEVYDAYMSQELTDYELELLSEGKLKIDYGDREQFGTAVEYYQYVLQQLTISGSQALKVWGIYLIIISEVIGLVMFMLARKSIQVRKAALFVFIMGIPVVIILLIYGSAILADVFA